MSWCSNGGMITTTGSCGNCARSFNYTKLQFNELPDTLVITYTW